jgi:hypothetical protein
MSEGPRPPDAAKAPRARGALSLTLLAVLTSVPAAARDLWTAQDGAFTVELNAFYKTLGTGLRMQRGLVEGSETLATLVEAARTTGSPEQSAQLPDVAAIPLYGGTWAHTARVWGTLRYRERLELQAGWQLTALAASDPTLLGSAALGTGVPVTTASPASRRLTDFDPVLVERDRFLLQHNLDLLALKVRSSFADVTIGRQVLSWGSGRLWNPTDLLSPFGPTDVDREVRRGVDAVRVSMGLAATSQLDLLWLPQSRGRDHGGVVRGQFNVRGFDVAPSLAKYVRDLVLGLDTTGDVGPLGVHGEVAWVRAFDRDAVGKRDEFVRAVAGVDWRPTESLVLTGEYSFNGWGTSDASGYLDVLRSPRVVRGEVFGAGRHYAGIVAAWQISPLLTAHGTAVANLADPSLLIVPALEYWAKQKLLVRVGGYLPLGRQPDPAPLRALTPQDVTVDTDAWRQAIRGYGLRSEYGASPYGLFAQIALYL